MPDKTLIKRAGFSPGREAELRGILLSILGSVPIELAWVENIPLTPHGKLVQVVREQASPALPC